MSEVKRYNFSWVKWCEGAHEDEQGLWVSWEDYARLKAFSDEAQAHIAKEERKSRERLDMEQAENARLKAEVDNLRKNADISPSQSPHEMTRLKAEVERLDAVIESHKDAGLRILAILDEERRLTKHLKAEVERLTEAGDAFYESEIGYYGEEIINDPKHHSGQMCRDWNAAKEGKPQP